MRYTIGGTCYTAILRGSTVVDIQPCATDQDGQQNVYPFFVRGHLRNPVAPMQTIERFTPERLIPPF